LFKNRRIFYFDIFENSWFTWFSNNRRIKLFPVILAARATVMRS
jgi:hypothetical protein